MTGAPDLAFSPADLPNLFSGIPQTSVMGEFHSVVTIYQNNGDHTDTSFTNALYLSPTPTFDAGTAILVRQVPGHLDPEELLSSSSFSNKFPNPIPQGVYYPVVVLDNGNAISEADETNNITVGGALQINKPTVDLSLVGVEVQPPMFQGVNAPDPAPVPFTAGVINMGSSQSAFVLRFTLSTDDTYGNEDDISIGDSDFVIAPPTQITPVSGMALFHYDGKDLAGKTYRLFVTADPGPDLTPETNTFDKGLITFLPDVVASSPNVGGTLLRAGQGYGVSVTFDNVGLQPTGESTFTGRLYLSTDDVLDESDVLVGEADVSAANPTANFTLPGSTAAGAYRLIAVADADNDVAEYNESNNIAVGPAFTLANPDPAVTGVTVTGGSLGGDTSAVKYTVALGNDTGINSLPVGVKLYLSSDDALSENDLLIGTNAVNAVVGANSDQNFVITPSAVPAGTYYIIAVVDLQGQGDANTGNNTFVSNTQITYPARDAVAGQPTGVPVSIQVGQTLSFTNHLTVSGVPANTTFHVKYELVNETTNAVTQLTEDALIFIAGDYTLGSFALDAQQNMQPTSVVIPSDLPAGTYRLRTTLTLDGDTNAANDVSGSQPFTVTGNNPVPIPAFDVSVGSVTSPKVVAPQGNLAINSTINLVGPSTAGVIKYFLSTDNTLDGSDILIGTQNATLNADGSTALSPFSAALPNTVADGTYFLIASADPDNAIPETNENNNTLVSATKVTVHPPTNILPDDLLVTLKTNKTTLAVAAKGGKMTLTAKNTTGATIKRNYNVTYYLSDDITFSPDDTQIGTQTLKLNLPKNKQKAFNLAFKLPGNSPLGTQHVIAVADSNPLVTADHFEVSPVTTLTVTAPHLVPSVTGQTIKGAKTQVTVSILNDGTANSSGPYVLKILSGDNTLLTSKRKIVVKPGATLTLKLMVNGTNLQNLSATIS